MGATLDRLLAQHHRDYPPGTVGLPAYMVAQMNLEQGHRAIAWRTLADNYPPTDAHAAWRELLAETRVVPAGQVAPAPQVTSLSLLGTLLFGGLVVAGLWWAVR